MFVRPTARPAPWKRRFLELEFGFRFYTRKKESVPTLFLSTVRPQSVHARTTPLYTNWFRKAKTELRDTANLGFG